MCKVSFFSDRGLLTRNGVWADLIPGANTSRTRRAEANTYIVQRSQASTRGKVWSVRDVSAVAFPVCPEKTQHS